MEARSDFFSTLLVDTATLKNVGLGRLQTSILFVILLLAAPSACIRAGFSGAGGSNAEVDTVPPPWEAGLSPAKLDEDCQGGRLCVEPLVCTGLPGQQRCRPPCADQQDCGPEERCGKPMDLQGNTLPVPRACLSVKLAERYESCGVSPSCNAPLSCINMPGESFWSFCGQKCADQVDCLGDERCEPVLTMNQGLCLRLCKRDSDCPGRLHCIGIGSAPDNNDYCLATSPAESDQRCDANQGLFCAAGNRCINIAAGQPYACAPLCGAGGSCEAGRECFTGLTAARDYCLRICDPSAPSCPSQHICFPHVASGKAFCISGKGLAEGQSCGGGGAPCDSGLMCVNSHCRQICKDVADCPSGWRCAELNNSGKPLPWRACVE